jgi:ankyrin repeat protein
VLLWAAQRGSEATAQTCVLEGANVGMFHNNRRTPLFWAASKGCEAVVRLILATGRVDVDLNDSGGSTPLSKAV